MPSAASLTDADWMATIATKGAKAAAEWWWTRIPTDHSKASMEDAIRVALRPSPGHRIYTDPSQRGFFICRPGRLQAQEGVIGSELVIWFLERELPPDEYRHVLRGLFTDWLRDEIARGEYEWGFGIMPTTMPAGDLAYLEAWVKAGGVKVLPFEHPEGTGHTWLCYYGRMKDAVELLP